MKCTEFDDAVEQKIQHMLHTQNFYSIYLTEFHYYIWASILGQSQNHEKFAEV